MNSAHAYAPRVGVEEGTKSQIPRVRSSSGTQMLLVRASSDCIGDHGKHIPEPWTQPVTGEPVHIPGASEATRSRNSSRSGEFVLPYTRRSNTPVLRDPPESLVAFQKLPPKGGDMWPYPRTHVQTTSQSGYLDQVAATLPSQAPAGAAQGAPDIE